MTCYNFLVILLLNNLVYAQAPFSDSLHTLTGKRLSITIDAGAGSRITSFKFYGEELLHVEVYNKNFGSALRLSPQGKWKDGDKLNTLVYKVIKKSAHGLLVSSTPAKVNGFTFSNSFQLHESDSSVTITYSITNQLNEAQTVSPWEVTRVPTGGLAFFPKGLQGDIPLTNKIRPVMTILDSGGIIWYPYDTSQLAAQKLMMKGSEGWLAYVRNGLIFIRQFPVISDAETAPEEKNVELWVNKEKTFIELENQVAYHHLQIVETLHYTFTWIA